MARHKFSSEVRRLRERDGMNDRQFAAQCGMTVGCLIDIEAGGEPHIRAFFRICDLYNLNPSYYSQEFCAW